MNNICDCEYVAISVFQKKKKKKKTIQMTVFVSFCI